MISQELDDSGKVIHNGSLQVAAEISADTYKMREIPDQISQSLGIILNALRGSTDHGSIPRTHTDLIHQVHGVWDEGGFLPVAASIDPDTGKPVYEFDGLGYHMKATVADVLRTIEVLDIVGGGKGFRTILIPDYRTDAISHPVFQAAVSEISVPGVSLVAGNDPDEQHIRLVGHGGSDSTRNIGTVSLLVSDPDTGAMKDVSRAVWVAPIEILD